jgi:hypothetical protein
MHLSSPSRQAWSFSRNSPKRMRASVSDSAVSWGLAAAAACGARGDPALAMP